jgi:hypothetical protein
MLPSDAFRRHPPDESLILHSAGDAGSNPLGHPQNDVDAPHLPYGSHTSLGAWKKVRHAHVVASHTTPVSVSSRLEKGAPGRAVYPYVTSPGLRVSWYANMSAYVVISGTPLNQSPFHGPVRYRSTSPSNSTFSGTPRASVV